MLVHPVAVGPVRGRGRLIEQASFNHHVVADDQGPVSVVELEDVFNALPEGVADFVKLDCEGAEYDILEQTPDAILRCATTYALEFHDRHQPEQTGMALRSRFLELGFDVIHFAYSPTRANLNYGMLVATQGE